MLKTILIACFAIAMLTVTAEAADVTGKWLGQVPAVVKQWPQHLHSKLMVTSSRER